MVTFARGKPPAQTFRQPPKREKLLVEGLARQLERETKYVPTTSFASDAVHGFGILGVFSQGKRREDKEMSLEFFRTALDGSSLIDLGAGPQSSVYAMAEFAAMCGVREYVAVDRYASYSPALEGALARHMKSTRPESGMSVELVNDDMLRHLVYRADESANILLNGIDGCVIPRESNGKYLGELIRQIARVIPHFGIALGTNSPFLGALVRLGFLKITDLPGHGEVRELPGFKESLLVKP